MKKMVVTLATLLVSASTWAMLPVYDIGDGEHGGHQGRQEKMHKCLHDGMKAAELTEDQHHQIHQNMMAAKQVKMDHKDAIHEGMRVMMEAWKQHPIVKADVVAAEENLKAHKMPVKAAMRDAMIDSLNLLSADQRQKFDAAVMACIHEN